MTGETLQMVETKKEEEAKEEKHEEAVMSSSAELRLRGRSSTQKVADLV